MGGGYIRRVKVSLEYDDGKTNTVWVKEGERVDREREVDADDRTGV